MSLPIYHHNRVIVLVFDQEAVGFLSAGDLVPGQELGGPHDAVEDQAEPPAFKGSCPVSLFGTVEQVALVSGVQAKGPLLTPLDTQLSSGKVSKTNSITMTLIALVPVGRRGIGIIHRAAIPGDRDVLACIV